MESTISVIVTYTVVLAGIAMLLWSSREGV